MMVGVIWFVQIVHYPLFGGVGREGFILYSERHSSRTTLIVGPLMLVEITTGVLLLFSRPDGVTFLAALVGMVLISGIWVSTALLQVPEHRILGGGFDVRAHRRLVGGNWLRTVAWTLRGILVVWMILQVM